MNPTFKKVHAEIQRGMDLTRCRKCGCMKGTLENLKASLPLLKTKDSKELLDNVNEWYGQLTPLEYPCLGCKYCIPPEAMTWLTAKYPVLTSATLSTCEITVNDDTWPPVEGEYTVLDSSAPVGVSTLASVKLEEKIVKLKPEGLCMIGKTETENIGIDKIVKNVASNPAIKFLILAGKDTAGHQAGKSLLALIENGVDKDMRIIGSKGRRPILKNVTRSEINKFRKQIKIEDMIGSENTRAIAKKIRDLNKIAPKPKASTGCGCGDSTCAPAPKPAAIPISFGSGSKPAKTSPGKSTAKTSTAKVPLVKAKKQSKYTIKLDKEGYFVIINSTKKGDILVEHYSNDNKFLRKIQGNNGRDIYFTIINNKWVSELSHAAYLGKELARAEMAIKKGFKFIQDGA
jgi:tetrahydromethanopterin S-methyltransferase subunit A